MEKSFQLDQRELQQAQALDQERTQALAMVGALSLDMEQARKNLETAQEKQRSFIRGALSKREVDQYENARMQNGTIFVSLPDNMGPIPGGEGANRNLQVERVNGPAPQ